MKTTTIEITSYEYNELNDFGQGKALANFKSSGIYQYAYAWSDKKCIETIIKDKMFFSYIGEIVPS